ncbi:hypothetical protein, partial [Butyricicoccus sp.]|uniref:hypothetical protein n=1 Tax=Butyricicoccus sp. TaxID=2049021 RepID=UPI003F17000E
NTTALMIRAGVLEVEPEESCSTYNSGDDTLSFQFEVQGATKYQWQRGLNGEYEDIADANASELTLAASAENLKYEYRCVATTAGGETVSEAMAAVSDQLLSWLNTGNVDLKMLDRALGAKSLESMIFEGNDLIYVRTGEAVATYDPETKELIDNRYNLAVATVDMENGIIYPIAEAKEASASEASSDAE